MFLLLAEDILYFLMKAILIRDNRRVLEVYRFRNELEEWAKKVGIKLEGSEEQDEKKVRNS